MIARGQGEHAVIVARFTKYNVECLLTADTKCVSSSNLG
ncbi:hypothetical protein C3B55_00989 [Candidatus Pseudomonas adelgestsugas]|uniref:Uncharacterized protein n=1 Tax=Candidatus Pseudomonas adelgestsugas TaxID=1302376 RepID=A0ABX5RAU1_9PSED|nr:hypothetical protein C3B55_00989 [Candidatus Pseudomonas adelgestsugas]